MRRMTAEAVPTAAALQIDCSAEAERISRWIVATLVNRLHRRGLVVAISGGIDSSVCAALAVRAVGPKRVYGLLLPERDSSPSARGRVAERRDGRIRLEQVDITPPSHREVWRCRNDNSFGGRVAHRYERCSPAARSIQSYRYNLPQ